MTGYPATEKEEGKLFGTCGFSQTVTFFFFSPHHSSFSSAYVCVCVSVYICVSLRAHVCVVSVREIVYVCVCVRACVRVCVSERERERACLLALCV